MLLGYADGKPIRPSFYGETRADVKTQINEAVSKAMNSGFVAASRRTVAEFLEDWLATSKPSIRPKTYRSYKQIVQLHLKPALGNIKLQRLEPDHVQRCLNALSASGLSPRTVQYVRAVLRAALSDAMRRGGVVRNVASLVTVPRVPHKEVQPLSAEESKAFLMAVRGHRLEALWEVAVYTGLRQGEVLGLRWSDVDLERKELRVSVALQYVDGKFSLTEPKTARSRRTLTLPDQLVVTLKRHRSKQAADRLLAGEDWDGSLNLVFATQRGTPLEGSRINRDFKLLLQRAGLRPQRFHDLRHGCASLLLAAGVPARMVMEWLGHSQIAVTMNTYAHLMPAAKEEAANKIAALLA